MLIRLVPAETRIDFIGKRVITYVLSLVLILGSVGALATKGLNFGIDFTGGTLIEIQVPEAPDLGALRVMLNELDLGAVSLQEFGHPRDLLIRLPQQEGDEVAQQAAIQTVRAAIDGYFDGQADYRRVEFVGPQVGEELRRAGIMAVLFALAGILGYVWFRFEWQFGVASISAVSHDVLITLGLFALLQWQFDLATLAALLMIAGYSINDTVVIFDRIRENMRKFKKKVMEDLLNLSINQTLARTIMTSVTTLLALIALWVFGGEVIRGFVNALIFGIVIGTYSSMYVASPILLLMNVRRKETDDAKEETEPGKAAPDTAS